MRVLALTLILATVCEVLHGHHQPHIEPHQAKVVCEISGARHLTNARMVCAAVTAQ